MEGKTSRQRFSEEFKVQAVKKVTEGGHKVGDVATRLGVSPHSLYAWLKRYSGSPEQRTHQDSQSAEVRRLKAELKRVSEERDILKKGRRVLCQAVGRIQMNAMRTTYANWIKSLPASDDEYGSVPCPACRSVGLSYQYFGYEGEGLGWKLIWCKKCKNGIHVSRVKITGKVGVLIGEVDQSEFSNNNLGIRLVE